MACLFMILALLVVSARVVPQPAAHGPVLTASARPVGGAVR